MTSQPVPECSNQPRTGGDLRRRLLRHYLPLALVSAGALVLFMNVAFFDANRYPPPGNIMTKGISGASPSGDLIPMSEQHGGEPNSGGQTGTPPTEQDSDPSSGGQTGTPPMEHGGDPNSGAQAGAPFLTTER